MKRKLLFLLFAVSMLLIFLPGVTLWGFYRKHLNQSNSTFTMTEFYLNYYPELFSSPDQLYRIQHETSPSFIWNISYSELLQSDSIRVNITNQTDETIYYTSWGTPLSRLNYSFLIHSQSQTDTLKAAPFGCSTGVFLKAWNSKATLQRTMHNPLNKNSLLQHIATQFPSIDSLGIFFHQPVYSPIWNTTKTRSITSPIFHFKKEQLQKLLNKTANVEKTMPLL